MPSTTVSRPRLLDQRGKVFSEMQSILDTAEEAGRDLTAEERQAYDKAEARLEALSEALGDGAQWPDLAAGAGGDLSARDHRASGDHEHFDGYLRGHVSDVELRALGGASGAAGGYLVPQGFRQKLVEVMKSYGGVRAVAEVITTAEGNDLPYPTVDDTSNVGAILAENTQVTEQDVTFGVKTLKAYAYTSKMVRVSLQLIQDSGFDVEPWLASALGTRIARAQNAHFTTGTATAQPEGIVTNAVVGKTGATGQTTTVIYNDLVELVASVDAAYRSVPGTGWMMHDTTWATLCKLRDDSGGAGLGRPLVEPDVKAGWPNTLLGYPVTVNNDMSTMAANVKSILFGNFKAGYVVRDARTVEVLRLEERYADYLQVGFLGFARSDGAVQDPAAYKAYRNSAT